LVNDQAGVVYTDAVLLPYTNTALDMLTADLRAAGAPYIKIRGAFLSVPSSTTPVTLTTASSPALPAALIEPLQLWERQASGAEQDYVPMEGPFTLPNFPPSSTLRFWDYAGDATNGFQIQLLGATATREVRIDGLYDVTQFVNTSDAVLIPGSTNAIAFRTAALIAGSRGDDNGAQTFNNIANAETEKLIAAEIMVQQAHPVRRQPAMGASRYLVFPAGS
jgi:hypothetical protein